jgi:hypothetical protein
MITSVALFCGCRTHSSLANQSYTTSFSTLEATINSRDSDRTRAELQLASDLRGSPRDATQASIQEDYPKFFVPDRQANRSKKNLMPIVKPRSSATKASSQSVFDPRPSMAPISH